MLSWKHDTRDSSLQEQLKWFVASYVERQADVVFLKQTESSLK